MVLGLINAFRLAARALLRRPGFTATAVVTLALGIGANVAIFTVVNAVLIQPLPYPDSDEIVSITHHAPGIDLPDLNHSEGTLNFYWQEADFLSSLAGYDVQSRNLVGGAQPSHVRVVAVTHQIFDVLRVQPMMGRPFNAEDALADVPATSTILTYDSWQNLFGGDPSVLGTTLEIDDAVVEVVGVMPRGFEFPGPDVVALTPMYVDPNGPFGTFGTSAVGRLAPAVTVDQAGARVAELQARIPDFAGGDLDAGFLEAVGWSASLETYRDELVGSAASALWIVLGTVAFVFLIACANVANLFLVRAESRQKELAIRAAMGAGRGRIAAGFLTEALSLGVAGGLVGVVLAWVGVDALVATSPEGLPRLHEVGVDGWVLTFAAIISVVAGLAFGSVPLVRHMGGAFGALLRDGGRANTAGRERHRTRNVLVASQLALALVLLVGSTLMLRSFQRLASVDIGINPGNVTNIGLSLGDGVEPVEAARFYTQVADEVAALPGVLRTGLSTAIPLGTGNWNGGSFRVRSRPRGEEELPPVAMFKAVDEGYLDIMGTPLEEGRNLARSDWQGGAPVILVNRTFADGFLEGQALGEGIHWGAEDADEFAEVVGIVGDAREMGREEEIRAMAYLPLRVGEWPGPELQSIYVLVESPAGQEAPIQAIRDLVYRLNPNVPLTTVETMEQVMSRSMADTSFTLVLLVIASLIALVLGAIGLFGVISYVVGQRTREIGVRVALGARSEEIQGMVFRQGANVVIAGVVVGLVGALGLSRVMGAILFEVSATDPVAFLVPPVVLVLIAVAATWLPARKASRVEPVEALRSE
jgi:predicted permease